MDRVFDLAIIGGGINGCGIARDAAGRGNSVFLCEMNDLASGTSSWSTKLVHGGLRYLEYYEFRLVREALADSVSTILSAVHLALEVTPPELSADLCDRGIILTGGGSQLKQFDRRLSDETGLPVQMAEDPLTSVVIGAGKMLSDFPLLRRISFD